MPTEANKVRPNYNNQPDMDGRMDGRTRRRDATCNISAVVAITAAHYLSFPGAGQSSSPEAVRGEQDGRAAVSIKQELSSGEDRVIKCSSRGVLYCPFIRDRSPMAWRGADHATHRDQRSHLLLVRPRVTAKRISDKSAAAAAAATD